ncbi:MAG TPA: hypothetical protein VN665_01595 [Candidatus Paceibacterota bacterium]|nr:hypothetical protein [Candidatus Paceibacterota bacterium]
MENFEKRVMRNSIETLSPAKLQLLKLEEEGETVFHGSGEDLESLEPRQAIDTERGPDGEPAVFASSKADYAIFMAIINLRNCPRGARSNSGASFDEHGEATLRFGATKDTLDQLTDSAEGWVYVFDKNKFKPKEKDTVEFVTHEPIIPLQKIKVTKADLPKNIEVTA